MSLEGFRVQIVLEAVQGRANDPFYRLSASSDGCYAFIQDPGVGPVTLMDPAGITGFQTHETMQGMTASLEFARGPLAVALADRIQPNDYLSIEIAGPRDKDLRLAFMGLVSDIRETVQSSPNNIRTAMTIQAEGLQKLFNQAIYNWQGVMGQGQDQMLEPETFAAYKELCAKGGATVAPHELIKEFVNVGISSAIWARVHKKRVKAGELFGFGTGSKWSSLFSDGNFPNSASQIMSTWSGSLWSMIESLAQPDIHELFWTIETQDGVEKPILVHRPRPFPDGGQDMSKEAVEARKKTWYDQNLQSGYQAGKGDRDWLALKHHVLGREDYPVAIGSMRQLSDHNHANSFHWAWSGASDQSSDTVMAKMALGWWSDRRGRAKYGFAPRQVSIGYLPQTGNFMETVQGLLRRVAFQEAPLRLLRSESLTYGAFLPGVHVGEAIEDHSFGKPTTGYLTSISHAYRSTPQGIQVSSTLGIARSLGNCTFRDYPARVRGLVDMVHTPYIQKGEHPGEKGKQGAKQCWNANSSAVVPPGGIPYQDQIKAAAARHNVPSWFLARLFQNESSFNRNPNTNKEDGDTVLGPMRIIRAAVTDANSLGYTKPGGGPATLEDRRDVGTSLDMAAFLLSKRYMPAIDAAQTFVNGTYWRWVADAYNCGADKAAANGKACGWSESGLVGYGKSLDVKQTMAAFGGIR